MALLVYLQTPEQSIAPSRVLLARFAQWWVALERSGALVRVSGIGTATTEGAASMLVNSQVERLCGPSGRRCGPVTIDVAELVAGVKDSSDLRKFLLDRRFDSEQVNALTLAAERIRSAQASVVAIQSGVTGLPNRSRIESGAVTIIDTPVGRLVTEHVARGGKRWLIVSPGSPGNISSAVQNMLRRLPAEQDWYSHRKVV